MRPRYPLPRLWLLTDERQGSALWAALRTLPPGSGVIFRHYSLGDEERQALFARIRSIARRRRLILLLSGTERQTRRWQADGYYAAPGHHSVGRLAWAAPVHNLREIRQAERSGADVLLLSPLFPTRSHPGSLPLGRPRFSALARATRLPVIALGGVQVRHARIVAAIGGYGWAGIDAFTRKKADG